MSKLENCCPEHFRMSLRVPCRLKVTMLVRQFTSRGYFRGICRSIDHRFRVRTVLTSFISILLVARYGYPFHNMFFCCGDAERLFFPLLVPILFHFRSCILDATFFSKSLSLNNNFALALLIYK